MKMMGRVCIAAALAVLASTVAAEQTGKLPGVRESFTAQNFGARRAALARTIPHSVVVLFGTKSVLDTWEEQRYNPHWHIQNFRQNENLFYLSGFDAPSVAAIFDTDSKVLQFYAPEITPAIVEETKRLQLPAARTLVQFETDLEKAASSRPIYIEARESYSKGPSGAFVVEGTAVGTYPRFLPGGTPGTFREDVIKAGLVARYPHAEFRSLLPVIREQRKFLDSEELAAIRKAVSMSVAALTAGIAAVQPGVQDIQIGAVMECTMRLNGSQIRAYAPDIQTGPNIAGWYTEQFDQYDLANRVMQAGEMTLVDQGAEYNYYQSDLARSIPVSGKFTAEQRVLYQAYQKAWRAGLNEFKPGNAFQKVGEAAAQAMQDQLEELPEWARPTAMQFVQATRSGAPGHFLSTTLDLHHDMQAPLKPGQVMAYEIHWFIPEKNWRFTIEDDILITPTGHEVLSQALPRDIEALEKLMAHPNPIGCSAPANPIAMRR